MSTEKAKPEVIVIRRKVKVDGGGHHGGSWKIAYADFVTAMMAFFLLLWLLSSPDKAKLEGIAQYFSAQPAAIEATAGGNGTLGGDAVSHTNAASSGSPSTNSETANDESKAESAEKKHKGDASRPDAALRVLAEELKISFQTVANKAKTTNQTSIKQDREGLRISLVDSTSRPMFRPGTAELYPYAVDAIRLITSRILNGSYRVAIEGHTDAVGGDSDANWRLSGDRANAARRVMAAAGLGRDRMAEVTALAGTDPAYPDDPNRAENRRIVIVILSEPSSYPEDITFKR